jgi:hypothetical protein
MRIDMAQYTLTVDGDELEELQTIVADILVQQVDSKVTEESYLQQMVSGFLRERIANAYVAFVRQQPLEDLKTLLGSARDIKDGNVGGIGNGN